MYLNLPQHRLCLVNLELFIKQKIEIEIINDLERYKLLQGSLNTEKKSFFYHHIILGICQYLLYKRTNDKIVFYYTKVFEDFELFKYFNEKEVIQTINKVIKSIKTYLPVRIYDGTISFESLHYMKDINDGKFDEIVSSIKSLSNYFEKHTFSRIKQFSNKHNLTFLNQQFFNDIKTGQLIFA